MSSILGEGEGGVHDERDKSPFEDAEIERFAPVIRAELARSMGASAVVVGENQPPAIHALAHAINQRFGNVGTTVFYTDPVDANPVNQNESIKDLVADMRAGKVDLLVILGGNPVYDAPADLNFADALTNSKIPLRVHHGLYQNETAELCQWHVNQTHELESWGDARAYDGTVSIIQPLIAPLYNGKSALEFVALLSGQSDATGYDLVRAYWAKYITPPCGGLGCKTFEDSGASRCTMDGLPAQRSGRKICASPRFSPRSENCRSSI